MAYTSPAYSFVPCRAAPCTDYHGSFCLNFTKCNHPLLADASNKDSILCTDPSLLTPFYSDLTEKLNVITLGRQLQLNAAAGAIGGYSAVDAINSNWTGYDSQIVTPSKVKAISGFAYYVGNGQMAGIIAVTLDSNTNTFYCSVNGGLNVVYQVFLYVFY